LVGLVDLQSSQVSWFEGLGFGDLLILIVDLLIVEIGFGFWLTMRIFFWRRGFAYGICRDVVVVVGLGCRM
jgi:hypothetical protein